MAEMKTLTINGATYEIKDEFARNTLKPLLIDADMSASYDSDDTHYGDEALQAILDGKQILVKTPNVSGDSYVASFSPIYMYQVPNQNNNYLYLFYLTDEKQNIDLSAMGMGTVQIPVYSQLKMKLSQTYTECPLK